MFIKLMKNQGFGLTLPLWVWGIEKHWTHKPRVKPKQPNALAGASSAEMKPTTKNRGKTQNFFLFSPFCFILLVLSQSREGWNPSLSEVLGMLNRLGAVAADSQPFKRLNPSLHPFFFSLLNGNNIQGDIFRRNLCLASVSALCRPGSRSSHCSLLFGGCPSCRCMLQNLFIWVLFWFFLLLSQLCFLKWFSWAVWMMMIFPVTPFFGRAFFQLTFFSWASSQHAEVPCSPLEEEPPLSPSPAGPELKSQPFTVFFPSSFLDKH